MTAYKPPFYITLGFYFMAKTPDGKIVGVPISIDEVGAEGIGAQIEEAIEKLEHAGLTKLTEAEYNDIAHEIATKQQQSDLAAAMHEHSTHKMIDQERLSRLMAIHKGREGGDA